MRKFKNTVSRRNRNAVYSPAPIVYVGNLGLLVFVVVSCELMMRRVDALGALPSPEAQPSFSPHESSVVVSESAKKETSFIGSFMLTTEIGPREEDVRSKSGRTNKRTNKFAKY
ncbi:hypothetical protein FGLOB1_12055 [Fusarium globosum]|uniref:Transmembrane protein n=1 Tax=Fusarium globosum TaxID=78864 RepID=A0A8H5XRB1_9HYPO|nr:hypothetical protein FGLOB1_12055 [Fusarium globosum]